MTPEPVPSGQRLLAAVDVAAAGVLWALMIWHWLDPGGPMEAFSRLRERLADWRRDQRELGEQLLEIQELPETEASCEDS